MEKKSFFDIFLLCLKILLPILIIIPLLFFSYRLVEGRMEDIANIGNESYHSGIGLYIFASHVLLLAVNIILLIFSCFGLLISKKYVSSDRKKKNIITFRYLSIAPICSQALYVIISWIVVNIGCF